uniref:WGS project CAEQ00000000 data, annotated contig 199 n=1 Tax=Trypanosoma congolense (strain IL3000) TaxID=1068625 RepID=F9WAM6_TRYCI|nr:unnamed protein product [Trypanosoma congolense IL3000]
MKDAPPPPARRQRLPFVTAFLGDILPFLSPRELLICSSVSRTWREETRALPLWRMLLINNPNTAQHAYKGLSLAEMQKIALGGGDVSRLDENASGGERRRKNRVASEKSYTVKPPGMFPVEREVCPRNNLSLCREDSAGESRRKIALPSDRNMLSFTKNSVDSLFKVFGTLQSYMVQLRGKVLSSNNVVSRLSNRLPSGKAIWLHHESIRLWRKIKFFEEVVTLSLSLYKRGERSLKGLRSFVQVEIVTSGEIGSPNHLQWCCFKRALPLDDAYYDYLDLLYLHGPSKHQPPVATASEIDEVVGRIQMYGAIQAVVDEVIMMGNSDSTPLSWDILLSKIENMHA